jgi:hypothetical protein
MMESAGILLIALAIALMLVTPIHFTVARPTIAPGAIGGMSREHRDNPAPTSEPNILLGRTNARAPGANDGRFSAPR